QPAAPAQDAACLQHDGDGVVDVLEQVLEHDRVEALVGERQRLADVAELDGAAGAPRGLHGVGRAVDAGVVVEVRGQPPGRGADALRADGWAARFDLLRFPADEGERVSRAAAEQALLPALARARRYDLLHSLASVAPVRAGVTAVITLHDVTFFRIATFDR